MLCQFTPSNRSLKYASKAVYLAIMVTHHNGTHGFTIVELLIVIVVIGILAAITIVSYDGIQQRAQIVAVSDGLKKVDRSMTMWMMASSQGSWPLDTAYDGGTDLSALIASAPGLKDYLQNVPSVVGVGTNEWFYDNDEVESAPGASCGSPYDGVNIVIKYLDNQSVAEGVDKMIDDGNLHCGKVKYATDTTTGKGLLFYSLSYSKIFAGNT